ncbi:MAG TPA: hypothetical protein VLT45_28235, partial [Kofleriaceae bacterium]|nr:hypothetical protein [Kofleriaceae bacterium]
YVIDVSALLASVGIESPIALMLPLGAVPFAVSLVAVALTRDLFGWRRATALVWAGAGSVIALAGFVRLRDVLDGGFRAGAALALAAAFVIAQVVHAFVFDRLRRAARGRATFVRIVVAALIACAFGFAALGGGLWLEEGTALASAFASNAGSAITSSSAAVDAIVAVAAGAFAWSVAVSIVLAIPAAIIARALAIALRVGRALVARRDVSEDDQVAAPAPVHASAAREYERAAKVHASAAPVHPSSAPVYERAARGTPAITVERTPRTTLPGVVLPAPGEGTVSSSVPAASTGASARSLPPAEIVDEDVVPLEAEAMRRRAPRVSLQPFSSAEMEFFREGDELGT